MGFSWFLVIEGFSGTSGLTRDLVKSCKGFEKKGTKRKEKKSLAAKVQIALIV
jgi:hypothetical protein